jgi:cytochrome c553
MANQEPTLADRAWTRWASIIVVAFVATGGLLGFVIIPIVQGQAAGLDAYTAICRSIGILPGSPAQRTPVSLAKAEPVSRVSWAPATLNELFHGDKAAGAKVAEGSGCVGCHAPDGTTADPTIPRMAAQSAFAIYKQLHDFKSGARVNEIMSAQVQNLDDKQIADVAAFYSTQVRGDVDIGRAGYAGACTRNGERH